MFIKYFATKKYYETRVFTFKWNSTFIYAVFPQCKPILLSFCYILDALAKVPIIPIITPANGKKHKIEITLTAQY